MKLDAVCQTLAQIAPISLAEEWDNVGLLVGDRAGEIARVMTCLTITPDVVEEAIEQRAGLIVTHHPLPFQPLKKITSDNVVGAMLLRMLGAGIAIYSAHTAFDSAAAGVNQSWADSFGVLDAKPLVPGDDGDSDSVGGGRFGMLETAASLQSIAEAAARLVGCHAVRLVGHADNVVRKVGFACGSGGSFLDAARRQGCDAMVTGEATFHTCLEARSCGVGLILVGHYHSERFAMEHLADRLAELHPDLSVWPSRVESDPLATIFLG